MNDIDKPWLNEPNALDFVDKKSGYHIALRRHPNLLHWCGYVGIPPTYPFHGWAYQDVGEHVQVHGGLTYSHNSVPGSECGATWWFGFDCAHGGDLVPKLVEYQAEYRAIFPCDETYRNMEYVKNEAVALAEQLAALASKKRSILDIIRSFG